MTLSETALGDAVTNEIVDQVLQQPQPDEGDALDSILETSVAEVDAALSVVDVPNNTLPPILPPTPVVKNRTGRWSLDEKVLFLYGLQKYGKGRWKKIRTYIPSRYVPALFIQHSLSCTSSLVQIKSHAQKVLKRLDSGENIFRRLEENCARLHVLVSQIHHQLGLEAPQNILGVPPPHNDMLAASALCQLGENNTSTANPIAALNAVTNNATSAPANAPVPTPIPGVLGPPPTNDDPDSITGASAEPSTTAPADAGKDESTTVSQG